MYRIFDPPRILGQNSSLAMTTITSGKAPSGEFVLISKLWASSRWLSLCLSTSWPALGLESFHFKGLQFEQQKETLKEGLMRLGSAWAPLGNLEPWLVTASFPGRDTVLPEAQSALAGFAQSQRHSLVEMLVRFKASLLNLTPVFFSTYPDSWKSWETIP